MKELTVGLIAGTHRDRARRALASLLGQSMARDIKVHVIDTEPEADAVAATELPAGLELEVTPASREDLIGALRAQVVRGAETPLVGFLEEHCVALPGWAAKLVAAHRDPQVGAAAGVISNLDSEPLLAKVAALCSYRASLPPVNDPEAEVLFGQNVCYKRPDLVALDSRLDEYLTTELLLFRHLRGQDRKLRVVGEAQIQHAGLARYVDVLHGVYHYDRAAWGLWSRFDGPSGALDYARVLLSPLARTAKTVAAESRLRGLPVITLGCLPFALAIHTAAAWGQLCGRLRGPGQSPRRYSSNELVTRRTDLPPLEA